MSYLSITNVFYFHCAYKAVCLLLFLYELQWARKKGFQIATPGQVASNFFIFLVGATIGGPATIYVYGFCWKFFSDHRLFEAGLDRSFGTFLLCAFLADFISYVGHRLSHSVPFLWALHSTHHTDAHVNISTSARHNFTALAYVFFSPLALLGAPADVLSAAIILTAIYPFWLHSRSIPKLPYVEWFFFTRQVIGFIMGSTNSMWTKTLAEC